MKIAVVGAGAMGCLYGAYLSTKHEVTMVDSYLPQVEAIREHGITIIEKDGTKRAFTTVKAAASGEVKEHMDLVIVFVKSTYTEEALAQNATLFQPDTLVMTLQNGAGNDRNTVIYTLNRKTNHICMLFFR